MLFTSGQKKTQGGGGLSCEPCNFRSNYCSITFLSTSAVASETLTRISSVGALKEDTLYGDCDYEEWIFTQ